MPAVIEDFSWIILSDNILFLHAGVIIRRGGRIMGGLFDSLKSYIVGLTGVIAWVFGAVSVFVVSVLALWICAYLLHVLIPSPALAPYAPSLAQWKSVFFAPADFLLGGTPEFVAMPANPSGLWIQNCYPEFWSGQVADQQRSTFLLTQRIFTRAGEIEAQIMNYQADLASIRSSAVWFSSFLIFLGLCTTVASALNSSEFGTGPSTTASVIKVVAIVLPALATAVTAYSALYASADQAARKSQVIFNLTALRADVDSALSMAPCPLTDEKIVTSYVGYVSDWTRRFHEIIASAEFGRSTEGGGQQEYNESGGKASSAVSGVDTGSTVKKD